MNLDEFRLWLAYIDIDMKFEIGTKRRSNRTADKSSKRLKLLSDAPLHLDTSIPFSPASVQQSDSFRVYRNCTVF